MHEAMEKAKKLCEMKDKLVSAMCDQLNMGIQNVNTNEAGEVVDMIKDLAEAEEKCWKACYYKSIVKSMKEEEEQYERMGPDERRGYDHWRYSSGRFAPTGRGTYSAGYRPMYDNEWAEDLHMEPWMSMGYSDGRSRSNTSSGRNYDSQNRSQTSDSGRYGYTPSMRGMKYDKYARARRGYDEHKDSNSKTQMDESAKEYVVDMAESVREMWRDADPALRKEIKNHFVALTGEMN